MEFALHPDIIRDTIEVANLPLCRVGLMNDSTYPWLILSPRLPGLRDLHDVPADRHLALMDEIGRAARALQAIYKPDKMNVAALGNATPQLHIHVIARSAKDPAWPKPVWGMVPPRPYAPGPLQETVAAVRRAMAS
ncbi:MAG: HIT domain-containing protein [Rhodospirillaceae bacterium]|nr:HIT domain-containing protein [Rhodospirillaceae bacterium]